MDIISNICTGCKKIVCCDLGPVFLTKRDISLIEETLGLHEDTFVTKIPYQGHIYYDLKTVDTRCVFFSDTEQICRIYPIRPLDCRAFPFDIHYRNSKLFWIYYNICKIDPPSIPNVLESLEKTFVPFLGERVFLYADDDLALYEQGKWIELREVDLSNMNRIL